MSQPKFAFRCKNCGTLETAEQAGERELPGACRTCRRGVRFEVNPDGTGFNVIYEDDNWMVLSECSAAELKEFGLTKSEVETHTVKKPKNVSVTASDGLTSKDKS